MAARLVDFKEDDIIIREGKVDVQMYIVVEGSVALYSNYGTDDERVLGICGVNKLFGELGLLTGAPSPYTAVAFSDVKLAYFTKNNLMSFIKGYPDMAMKILYNIAKMNELLSENLSLLYKEIAGLKKENSDIKTKGPSNDILKQYLNSVNKKTDRFPGANFW